MMVTDKRNTPMDTSIGEKAVGSMHVNKTRVCWALKTLVAEVLELFPETPVEYANHDGRRTALSASFDLTVHDEQDADDIGALLILLNDPAYNEDPRIESVVYEEGQAHVLMRSDPRTQDSREPFGLADAWLVLAGDETP